VRRALDRAEGAPAGDLASQLTSSVDAYRAYVRGEAYYNRSRFEEAIQAFREATRLDPDFALAHYRLSTALSWYGQESWEESAQRALARVEKLPPVYQDMVRALALPTDEEAIALYEHALTQDPENKEVLWQLSDLYIHDAEYSNPERAVDLMEKVLALDPDFGAAYEHLGTTLIYLGRKNEVHQWLDRWERKDPDTVVALRAKLLLEEKKFDEALALALSSSSDSAKSYRPAYAILAPRWDRFPEVLRDTEKGSRWVRTGALVDRAAFHAYRGQFEQAQKSLLQVAGEDSGVRYSNVVGFKVSALHGLAEILTLKKDFGRAQTEALKALAIQPEGAACLYFAGFYACLNEDLTTAETQLNLLEKVHAGGKNTSSGLYFDALKGELLLSCGSPEEARVLLEDVVGSGMLLKDWSLKGATMRDGLARAYLALGEKNKAIDALEALLESGLERLNHPVLYVRALYTLGVLYAERGDQAKSREYLERFLEHWGNADWDLPEVRDARARLSRPSSSP